MVIDKHKNIDKYVSKLSLIIKDKIKLVKVISMVRIDRIMLFIENKANEFNKKMDNDTLCLIDETIAYLIKMLRKSKIRLKTISVYQTNCRKALTEILIAKNDDKRNIKEIQKTFSVIDVLLKSFKSEKVGKEKYHTKVDKDNIAVYSICKAKGFSKLHHIDINRDLISMAIEEKTKDMNKCNTICIKDKYIILKLFLAKDCNEINKEISISIYTDRIISNSSIITNEHNKNINNEIMCSNKIRYIILMKIMYCLFKILKPLNKET